MPYEMNFISPGPSTRYTVRVCQHSLPTIEDSLEVFWFIIMLSVVFIEMLSTINKTGKGSVVSICLFLDFEDAYQLLIELTCPVVHAPKS